MVFVIIVVIFVVRQAKILTFLSVKHTTMLLYVFVTVLKMKSMILTLKKMFATTYFFVSSDSWNNVLEDKCWSFYFLFLNLPTWDSVTFTIVGITWMVHKQRNYSSIFRTYQYVLKLLDWSCRVLEMVTSIYWLILFSFLKKS